MNEKEYQAAKAKGEMLDIDSEIIEFRIWDLAIQARDDISSRKEIARLCGPLNYRERSMEEGGETAAWLEAVAENLTVMPMTFNVVVTPADVHLFISCNADPWRPRGNWEFSP